MRDSTKQAHCAEMAKKCISQAKCYSFCELLAPTLDDSNYADRKYRRALRHAKKYISLMEYYGGTR